MDKRFQTKSRGVLLHITSLPGDFGIGGLGKEAIDFIDYLDQNGFNYWQILPLNYPGFGYSPYNAISSFAGNPFLIDPEWFLDQDLITEEILHKAEAVNTGKVNFPSVYQAKEKLFRKAYNAYYRKNGIIKLDEYVDIEGEWLKPFAVFCVLRQHYKGAVWQKWHSEHRFYTEQMFCDYKATKIEEVYYHIFLQYVFDLQLSSVKQYARDKGIGIIGDLPLYVALNSCDTWSHPDLFDLDANGNPTQVAGVPPDAFSETGQLWGNPLYNWDYMRQDNYAWWRKRLAKAFVFADKLRLDHFIGYVNYWAVNASDVTALNGKWLPGPKTAFFDEMLRHFPPDSIIAEDLGILTDEINDLRDSYQFPGMIILQFCFQHDQNDILSFPQNRIIYTGTHDNQTTTGWFNSNLTEKKPDNAYLKNYLCAKGFIPEGTELNSDNVAELMRRLADASPCHLAIIPMQDILALDDRARMNIPGIAEGNWEWRCLTSSIYH